MGRVIGFELNSQEPEKAAAFIVKCLAGRWQLQIGIIGQL